MKGGFCVIFSFGYAILVLVLLQQTNGVLDGKTQRLVSKANKKGPYLGLVIPHSFEMKPLYESPSFIYNRTIDISGKLKFRLGTIEGEKVILVMSRSDMLNACITTQLLLKYFNIEGVIHYGIAGNANPSLHIGDVTIPQYWSHTALWNWQRYEDGSEDEPSHEVNGNNTREIAYPKFGDHTKTNSTSNVIHLKSEGGNSSSSSSSYYNMWNNVCHQPEELFPMDDNSKERQNAIWVPVDSHYFQVCKSLEKMKLKGCLNAATRLFTPPRVTTVERGISSGSYLDNVTYRTYMYNKFKVSPVATESAAAVAIICYQERIPFIAIGALSDLAGGGSESDKAVPSLLLPLTIPLRSWLNSLRICEVK